MLAASEAIAFEGGSFTSRALEIGEAMTIRCDGTAFKIAGHTPPLMSSRGPGVITITDRVTSAPVSPTPGARYIVQTGFSTYATHDIIEANSVSFNKYTPAADCGWIAYVQDEDRYYSFQAALGCWGWSRRPRRPSPASRRMPTRRKWRRAAAFSGPSLLACSTSIRAIRRQAGTERLRHACVPIWRLWYGSGDGQRRRNYSIALDTAFSDTN